MSVFGSGYRFSLKVVISLSQVAGRRTDYSGRLFMLGELNPCGGGDPIPLLKEKLLIGRRSRCDISLKFPNVSSHHCELEFLEGYWIIRDLGSRNGIKVNGTRCQSKWLMPGDTVSIAKHDFEIRYTPQGMGPPPEEEDPFEMSLMEKAGLERRETRPRRGNLPQAARPIDLSQTQADPEEDEAMKWLSEDEPASEN